MLKRGDLVDLIAPASGFNRVEYDGCLKFIDDLGLKARVPAFESLIDRKYEFCSNSAQYRFNHLADALKAEDSKAIWCMAGGYSSYQLLEMLDSLKPQKQKLFIGFSDITVLLNYLCDKWNWLTLHGPMLKNLGKGELSKQSVEQLKNIIFGDVSQIEVTQLVAYNDTAKKEGEIKGKIIGGCLSLMQVFLGTPQDIDYKDKILLLEDDRFETPARVSRILDQMLRAGIFNKVKAVILGSFLEEDTLENKALNVAFSGLKQELDKQGKPLLWGKDLGHCSNMQPLILGAETVMKTGKEPRLTTRVASC